MAYRAHVVTNKEQADPYSGSSLVPMLVIGLLLTFAGMIAALAVELRTRALLWLARQRSDRRLFALRGPFQIANQALKQIDQRLDLVVAHARNRQFIAGINGRIDFGKYSQRFAGD